MKSSAIGFILLYITGLSILAFGLVYIYIGYTKGLMPYHVHFLGKSCNELPPNVCELMRTFVKIIGFAFTSIGLVFLVVSRGLQTGAIHRQGYTIVIIFMIVLAPIILIMKELASYTPWWMVTLLLIMGIAGVILSKKG